MKKIKKQNANFEKIKNWMQRKNEWKWKINEKMTWRKRRNATNWIADEFLLDDEAIVPYRFLLSWLDFEK